MVMSNQTLVIRTMTLVKSIVTLVLNILTQLMGTKTLVIRTITLEIGIKTMVMRDGHSNSMIHVLTLVIGILVPLIG